MQMGAGWNQRVVDGQIWVCPNGILTFPASPRKQEYLNHSSSSDSSHSTSDSDSDQTTPIQRVMDKDATPDSLSSSSDEEVMNMSTFNRPNMPFFMLKEEIRRQKEMFRQSLAWDYFFHEAEPVIRETDAEDSEGVVWDPYLQSWTQSDVDEFDPREQDDAVVEIEMTIECENGEAFESEDEEDKIRRTPSVVAKEQRSNGGNRTTKKKRSGHCAHRNKCDGSRRSSSRSRPIEFRWLNIRFQFWRKQRRRRFSWDGLYDYEATNVSRSS